MLNIGDIIGCIRQSEKDGKKYWRLVEAPIDKIVINKSGAKYYSKRFYPLDAEDVDVNTYRMDQHLGSGIIFVREVLHLNDTTRPFAENWIKYANENPDKDLSML